MDLEFLMKIEIGMHAFVGWIQRLTACASHISDVLKDESNFPLMSTQVRVEDWKKKLSIKFYIHTNVFYFRIVFFSYIYFIDK